MKGILAGVLSLTLASCSTMQSRQASLLSDVVVTVEYTAVPGKEEAALEAVTRVVNAVKQNEPENHGISILQNSDDKAKITLIEHWTSKEHFLGPHMAQPHIQNFIDSSHDFLSDPPKISFWKSAQGP